MSCHSFLFIFAPLYVECCLHQAVVNPPENDVGILRDGIPVGQRAMTNILGGGATIMPTLIMIATTMSHRKSLGMSDMQKS
jgi:hypothetical protein